MQLRAKRNSVILLALFFCAQIAHASTGTISSTNKYAWGNNAGWVNFAPTNSTITVSDSVLTGSAWSATNGWINLSPTNGGVTNDGSGTLGGFAWDQTAGWVAFTGVTIDSSGIFHGQATGSNDYAISFDCSSCRVETTWRQAEVVADEPVTPVVATPAGSISPVYIPPAQTRSVLALEPSAGRNASPLFWDIPGVTAIGDGVDGSGGASQMAAKATATQSATSSVAQAAKGVEVAKRVSAAEQATSTTKVASGSRTWYSVIYLFAFLFFVAILLLIWWRSAADD